MKLDSKAIDHLAVLSRLALTDAEKTLFTEQLNKIVAAVEKIGALDLASIEPVTTAVPLENVFREDRERPSLPREDVLALAPERTAEGFLVPRVLAEGA
jgi:aspartyl-tRNA(Asn)/glutamyl-tRNA(Gln) amidotransferase subunit C